MFSPGVFVCLCVSVCLCLSQCLSGRFNYEGLMRHKNSLQVHNRRCLVFMFHVLMTSPMMSAGHKIGPIWKLLYLQYFSRSVDQKFKISIMPRTIVLIYSTFGITSGKTVFRNLKMAAILKFLNMKHVFNLISDMKRASQIMPKKYFSWWWRHRWRHRVARKSALYIHL